MAQNKIPPNDRLTERPPVGMNDTVDPGLEELSRAALMFGLAQKSAGVLEIASYVNTLFSNAADGHNIQGVFQYLADNPANDVLLIIKNNGLYTAPMTSGQPNATIEPDSLNPHLSATPTGAGAIPALVTNNSGVSLTGTRYRFAQIGNEVFFVPKEGGACVRFDGTHLYATGITMPNLVNLIIQGFSVTGGAAGALTGTYRWLVTFGDSKGRESSPSVAIQNPTYPGLVMAGAGVNIAIRAQGDAQVQKIYIYRTTAGGTVFYRIKEAGYSNTNQTIHDYGDETGDGTGHTPADSMLIFNTPAPLTFENEVPNPASVIAEWKGHLVLNDTTDPRTYQISNINLGTHGPTQFSLNGVTGLATDGITKRASDSYGSAVVAFLPMGSALGIGLTRGWRLLFGNQPSNFDELPIIGAVGVISTDSVARGINSAFFRAEDGIYEMLFSTGFTTRRVSADLDGQFRGIAHSVYAFGASYVDFPSIAFSDYGSIADSMGFYDHGRYILFGPAYIAVYNTENGGWVLDSVPGANLVCGASVLLDRCKQVLLVTPTATPLIINTYSFYPLADLIGDKQFIAPRHFAWKTNAIDGAGQPRSDEKDVVTVTVFGEFVGGQIGVDGGHVNAHLDLYIQVNSDVTKVNANPAGNPGSSKQFYIPWDSPWPNSPSHPGKIYDMTGDANYDEWQMDGKLFEGDVEVPSGSIIQVVVSGSYTGGRPFIRAIRTEYARGTTGV